MKVISNDDHRHYELCDQGVDLFSDNRLLARILADDIDRLSTILRYRREIASLEIKVQKEADGTANIPSF